MRGLLFGGRRREARGSLCSRGQFLSCGRLPRPAGAPRGAIGCARPSECSAAATSVNAVASARTSASADAAAARTASCRAPHGARRAAQRRAVRTQRLTESAAQWFVLTVWRTSGLSQRPHNHKRPCLLGPPATAARASAAVWHGCTQADATVTVPPTNALPVVCYWQASAGGTATHQAAMALPVPLGQLQCHWHSSSA